MPTTPCICGHCGSTFGHCPECGTHYDHGSTAVCTEPACVEKNAPVDCECGFIVEADLRGVLNFDLRLVPWKVETPRERRERTGHVPTDPLTWDLNAPEASAPGTFVDRPCGCRVVGNGTLPYPFSVLPCVAHREAP